MASVLSFGTVLLRALGNILFKLLAGDEEEMSTFPTDLVLCDRSTLSSEILREFPCHATIYYSATRDAYTGEDFVMEKLTLL